MGEGAPVLDIATAGSRPCPLSSILGQCRVLPRCRRWLVWHLALLLCLEPCAANWLASVALRGTGTVADSPNLGAPICRCDKPLPRQSAQLLSQEAQPQQPEQPQGVQKPQQPQRISVPVRQQLLPLSHPLQPQALPLRQPSVQQPSSPMFPSPHRAPVQPPAPPHSEEHGGADAVCSVKKLHIKQEHLASSVGGMTLIELTGLYGSGLLSKIQASATSLRQVSQTSFMCIDDRLTEPSFGTPGGDLGEFLLAIGAYLQEKSVAEDVQPTQELVDVLLQKYVDSIPSSRSLVHCTDEQAIRRLEASVPVENLDLRRPPDHVKRAGLLQKLTDYNNQGDSHVRLMLKEPQWFQLHTQLLPMLLKSFYTLLWQQHQDVGSKLYEKPKLRLVVLEGNSDPEAFVEVSAPRDLCRGRRGVAPALVPRQRDRRLLVSHLGAVSFRRAELAVFLERQLHPELQSASKAGLERIYNRLERHGWEVLEATGSKIAAGLPFYTMTYS